MSTDTTQIVSVPAVGAVYHWIITVQTERGGIATLDGIVPIVPGVSTHTHLYLYARQAVTERLKISGGFHVLFFTATPDRLGAVT